MRGTVGFVEAPGTVFIQDETGGTFFRTKEGLGPMHVGAVVEVEGVTVPGLYLTGIEAAAFKIVGQGAAPVAEKATFDDLATGRFHYQRVEVEGIGRRLTALEENRSLLFVAMGSRVIELRVDAPPPEAMGLIDAKLRITGLAAGGINDRRQLVFPYLRVAGWEDVTIVKQAPDLGALAVTQAASLLRFVSGGDQASGHRVRVAGMVLAAFADGQVFVRDVAPVIEMPPTPNNPARPMGNSLGIRFTTLVNVKPGEVIEAAGFPGMEGFSAGLADAVLLPGRPVATAVTAESVAVTTKELLSGAHDADLVTLPAVLRDFFRTADGMELRLTAEAVSIRAVLPLKPGPQPFTLAPGMGVQVTGICRVEASTDKGFRSQPQRAALLLRGPADLRVLQAPSWWTAQRLAWATTGLGVVIALGLLWITALRRRIARQAAALRQRIAREAVLEERQRIAREFHDTLEQELAGLSLRLDAATTRPLEDKARGLLQASLHLVARIQIEARNLVADLRAEGEEATDLTLSLENLLARQAGEGVPEVRLVICSPLPKLPAHVVHHLRMIAQEAVTNAMKHARAGKISIEASAEAEAVVLSVCDDGQGLDAALTHGKPGHFGCMGIRERCRKIGAEVEWKSGDTGGTCVAVRYPLTMVATA
jgi:signal transduction histidine kinase